MSKKVWALLVSVYICTLVAIAPASVLNLIASHFSDGRVEFANARGSIWSGSANPVFHQRDGGLVVLNALRWDVAPLSLLTGKFNIQMNWDDEFQAAPMSVSISRHQAELHHIYIPLQAMLLDEVSDFLKPAGLRGKVILKSESLLITTQGIQGSATADWLNASSFLSSVAPLGDYHFTFSGTSSGIDIALNTISGALILNGQGRFVIPKGLSFNGTAQAAKGREEELRELLGQLGPQVQPGISTFTLVPSL